MESEKNERRREGKEGRRKESWREERRREGEIEGNEGGKKRWKMERREGNRRE